MTQKDKELLLKDLCARLPYHIIVNYRGANVDLTLYIRSVKLEDCKPYLRPMSLITKEELNEFKQSVCPDSIDLFDSKYLICPTGNNYGVKISYQFMDSILTWLRSHHFDYNGLIEKGLALEALEGMYET